MLSHVPTLKFRLDDELYNRMTYIRLVPEARFVRHLHVFP